MRSDFIMPINTNDSDYQVVVNNDHTLPIDGVREEIEEIKEEAEEVKEESKKVEDKKEETVEEKSKDHKEEEKVEAPGQVEEKKAEELDLPIKILEQFAKIYKNNF